VSTPETVTRIDNAAHAHCMRVTRIVHARELLKFETRRLRDATPENVFVRVRSFEQASERYLQAIAS